MPFDTKGGAVTTTNTYGTHDQLLTSGSKSYGYDNAGNCTSVTVGTSVTSISYDYENRVVQISYPSSATNSFAYNGDDMRMQKVDSAGTANYVCDGTAPASAVLSDSSAVYTPGLSERRSSTSKFYHGDNLGSTRGITNSSQTVTDAILFDAFGNTVSRTGTTPTPFGFVGTGQYQTDTDSGLMLLGHRYYDASVGRFISSDPAKAGNNWYAYCENNPLIGVDPEGLDETEKGYQNGDAQKIKGTIGHIRKDGGGVGKRIGRQIDKPGKEDVSGRHIRFEPLDPDPKERIAGKPDWWPHSRVDKDGDLRTWVIYLDPSKRPTYVDHGITKPVPLESLISHEFGHLFLLNDGKDSTDEKAVHDKYQIPLEKALHLPIQK